MSAYEFDADSVYKAQDKLFKALVHMEAVVERPLRHINYPEMPAAVLGQVQAGVADVISTISTARVSIADVAKDMKQKTYDLVDHKNPNDIGWLKYMPDVAGVSLNLGVGGVLPNLTGGGASVQVGLLWDANGVHVFGTPSAGASMGTPGPSATVTGHLVGSWDAANAESLGGPFDTTSVSGGAGVVADGSTASGTDSHGRPVHVQEIGGGVGLGEGGSATVSPGMNHTYVSGGLNYYHWIPGL